MTKKLFAQAILVKIFGTKYRNPLLGQNYQDLISAFVYFVTATAKV